LRVLLLLVLLLLIVLLLMLLLSIILRMAPSHLLRVRVLLLLLLLLLLLSPWRGPLSSLLWIPLRQRGIARKGRLVPILSPLLPFVTLPRRLRRPFVGIVRRPPPQSMLLLPSRRRIMPFVRLALRRPLPFPHVVPPLVLPGIVAVVDVVGVSPPA